jgi:hypothetical protein
MSSQPQLIYNEFYLVDPDGKVEIHHRGLVTLLHDKGFFWLQVGTAKKLVHADGKVVREADLTDVTNFIYNYTLSFVPEDIGNGATKKDLLNLLVRGVDKYITGSKLRFLPVSEIEFHHDSKTDCFFYFKNGVVKVTAEGVHSFGYIGLNNYIWKSQIKPHSFTLLPEDASIGDFELFCVRVCNNNAEKFSSLKSIIGYLLHRYITPSNTVIPCLLDESVTGVDEANGGTGKTLICYALSFMRNMVHIDGKNFRPDGSFAFQRIEMDTEIIFIDDISRSTPFETFFSIVSLGLEVNQKNRPAFKIAKDKTPKLVLTSNFPIKSIAGESTERRKIEFETSGYYSLQNQPRDEFGKEFFNDWSETEFNQMFNFFARCVQFYLKNGLIKPPSVNTELRKIMSNVGIDLFEFLEEKITEGMRKFQKAQLYENFCKAYPGQRQYYPSPNKFTMKVKKYLMYKSITFVEIPAATKKNIELTGGNIPLPPLDETG